jgi:hypothetical protein
MAGRNKVFIEICFIIVHPSCESFSAYSVVLLIERY